MSEVYELVKLGPTAYAEGYVRVLGYDIYWKSFGEPKKGTILVLHGGPGGSMDPMISMSLFSQFGYRVVFYDQLGGGNSEKPQNIMLYTMDHFVEEVEGVRKNLNLGKVHLYGASWGGFLAPAYAVKYWRNLKSLQIESGTCSTQLFFSEIEKLRSKLPRRVQEALKKHENLGDYTHPEYDAAMKYVYGKHAWHGIDPRKHPQIRMWIEKNAGQYPYPVYKILFGINDFHGGGNIWHWDVTDQLKDIEVPTLITVGRYDEVSPGNSEVLHRHIKGSKLVIFENSAHHHWLEEPEKWLKTHREFLEQVA